VNLAVYDDVVSLRSQKRALFMKTIKKKQVVGAFLGTIVEYYDYSLYGFSAAIIAEKFFASADPITNLMKAFAVYAAAYLSKPFGAILFGYIGDHHGRKISLNFTILGIAIPTMIIGLLPDYSSIGYISTIILVICRILQGIFVAGEYDGAAIYVIEHLGAKYQSTASAITRGSGVLGLLLGIGATNFFNAHIFPDWGWRIPFLLSMPLSLLTLYYRSELVESAVFEEAKKREITIQKLKDLIKEYWRSILAVILLSGGFGATYQISIIFTKQYLPIVLPQTQFIISSFSILLVLCFGLCMPFAGFLADKYGAQRIVKIAVISTLISCCLFIAGIKYEMINLALSACIMLSISVAPFNALAHSLMVSLFPIKARYRGIGIGHTIGSMLMSGSANYICLFVIKDFDFLLFPIIYVMFFAVLTYLISRSFKNFLHHD
jgi:MFS transporter, MHS family, proline/betaine transporter